MSSYLYNHLFVQIQILSGAQVEVSRVVHDEH